MLDWIAVAVLVAGSVWLTIPAYLGDPRATGWGKGFARYVVGPVFIILFFQKLTALRNAVMDLQVDLASTPKAPIGNSAGAIQSLEHWLDRTNFLSPLLCALALAYALDSVPRIVAARRAKAEGDKPTMATTS